MFTVHNATVSGVVIINSRGAVMVAVLLHDIFEIRFEGVTSANTRWNVVAHYRCTTPGTEELYEAALDLAQSLSATFVAEIMPLLSDQSKFTGVRASSIYPQLGPPSVVSQNPTVVGGQAGAALPPDVAACTTKRTNEAGRNFTGRAFLPGIPEPDVGADLLSEFFAQSLADGLLLVLGGTIFTAGGSTFEGVVFSRTLADAGATALEASRIVARCETDRVTRNMRTRGLRYRLPVVGS